jgi:hypothetical protein
LLSARHHRIRGRPAARGAEGHQGDSGDACDHLALNVRLRTQQKRGERPGASKSGHRQRRNGAGERLENHDRMPTLCLAVCVSM